MKLRQISQSLVIGIGCASLLLTSCTQQTPIASQPQPVGETQPTADTTPAEIPAAETPTAETPAANVTPDVPYVPTPQVVVDRMLELAKVGPNDVVYDLGSGDGRLVITAAQKFKAKRGVGIEIQPDLVQKATQNAQKAGVGDRVTFRQQDLFKTNFGEASVVTLYLLPDINLKLRPQLLTQLKPGTRIVSHAFDMGDWKPEQTVTVKGPDREYTLYKWTVPKNVPENLKKPPSS